MKIPGERLLQYSDYRLVYSNYNLISFTQSKIINFVLETKFYVEYKHGMT